MRAAPPVVVRCAPAAAWRCLQAGLPALAAAVLLYWSALYFEWAVSALALTLASIVAVAVFALAWRSSAGPALTLQWDGAQWTLDGHVGRLQLMADFGAALLLRHDGRRWLMPTRAQAGAAWHGLRTAVVAQVADTAAVDSMAG